MNAEIEFLASLGQSHTVEITEPTLSKMASQNVELDVSPILPPIKEWFLYSNCRLVNKTTLSDELT